MNLPMLILGLTATLGGCGLLYLASPNQRLLARPLAAGRAVAAAVLTLILGQAGLLVAMRPLGAVFTFVIAAMLALVLLPYLGAWASLRRGS